MELKDLNEQEAEELKRRLAVYDAEHPQEIIKGYVRTPAGMKERQLIIRDYLQELTQKDFEERLKGRPDAILQDMKDTAPTFLRETLESYQDITNNVLLYAGKERQEKLEDCAIVFGCDIVDGSLILNKTDARELLLNKYELHLADLQNIPEYVKKAEKLINKILDKAPEVNKEQLPARENYTGRKLKTHNVMQSKELALPFDIFNPVQNEARNQVNGQITMLEVSADHRQLVGTGKDRHKETIKLSSFFSINFSETLPPEIAKYLDFYDRLVYGAIDSIMHTSGNLMTLIQIYRAMGYSGEPNSSQIDEIWNSLQKMQGAFIWYDFTMEQKIYKKSDYSNIGIFDKETGRPKPQAGEALLSIKAIRNVYINGNQVDAIQVTDAELPLYRAARARGYQISAVPIECLQLPGKMRRNNKTLALVFAVLETITKLKNPRKEAHPKMLYSTLYEKCGIPAEGGTASNRVQRQRVRDTLFNYLEHLKKIGYIDGYREDTDGAPGVIILYTEDALPMK